MLALLVGFVNIVFFYLEQTLSPFLTSLIIFLGAEGGPVCDSLPASITSITKPIEEFSVFPNPACTEVYLTLSKQKVRSAEVYNSFGHLVECTTELIKDEYIQFDLSTLQSGVYHIEIVSDKGKQVKMVVKE